MTDISKSILPIGTGGSIRTFLNATLTQELNEIRISIDNLVEIANENAK